MSSSVPHSPPARRARVLIVDDDPLVAKTTAMVLAEDHDCSTATSGRAALDLLVRGEQFDVILCDVAMPSMSGVELYREVQQRDAPLAERMIFVTGGAVSLAAQELASERPSAFLYKPYQVESLLSMVRERLR